MNAAYSKKRVHKLLDHMIGKARENDSDLYVDLSVNIYHLGYIRSTYPRTITWSNTLDDIKDSAFISLKLGIHYKYLCFPTKIASTPVVREYIVANILITLEKVKQGLIV